MGERPMAADDLPAMSARRDGGESDPRESWDQRAAFSVFFDERNDPGAPSQRRTRVYHEESGAEATLPESPPFGWASWIAHRIAGPPSVAPGLPALAALTVQVTAVHVIDDSDGDQGAGLCLQAQVTVGGLSELGEALGAKLAEALFTNRASL